MRDRREMNGEVKKQFRFEERGEKVNLSKQGFRTAIHITHDSNRMQTRYKEEFSPRKKYKKS